jgi:hypothetical protein
VPVVTFSHGWPLNADAWDAKTLFLGKQIADSAYLSAKIVKNATLKVIPGAPHGMCTTHADQVNAALLEFLKA